MIDGANICFSLLLQEIGSQKCQINVKMGCCLFHSNRYVFFRFPIKRYLTQWGGYVAVRGGGWGGGGWGWGGGGGVDANYLVFR